MFKLQSFFAIRQLLILDGSHLFFDSPNASKRWKAHALGRVQFRSSPPTLFGKHSIDK